MSQPMEPPSVQLSPFTQHLLRKDSATHTNVLDLVDGDLISLLPASKRTREGDLTVLALPPVYGAADIEHDSLQTATIQNWIDEELDINRLSAVQRWLWLAGRPAPPLPLHRHRMLNREIIITERLNLHLVWEPGRVFIKPIPRYLLELRFWAKFLQCHTGACSCGGRRERALGFLFSYTALIQYESDFHIAREAHLIPEDVLWLDWRIAVQQLLGSRSIYAWIDPRFHYGELRLSRLDKIYYFGQTPFYHYMPRTNRFFLRNNLSLLAGSTVYIAVVLTAMQLGLATEALQNNSSFQTASYGFTIFSIVVSMLVPLVAISVYTCTFCGIFITNFLAVQHYHKRRLQRIMGQ